VVAEAEEHKNDEDERGGDREDSDEEEYEGTSSSHRADVRSPLCHW
jgi:hypothetical protein